MAHTLYSFKSTGMLMEQTLRQSISLILMEKHTHITPHQVELQKLYIYRLLQATGFQMEMEDIL
jgi:outer membrane lipopolysaccharide assembly protein LptE/RlpB